MQNVDDIITSAKMTTLCHTGNVKHIWYPFVTYVHFCPSYIMKIKLIKLRNSFDYWSRENGHAWKKPRHVLQYQHLCQQIQVFITIVKCATDHVVNYIKITLISQRRICYSNKVHNKQHTGVLTKQKEYHSPLCLA